MENTYRRYHNEDFDDPWGLAKEDGYLFFVVLWDHWQSPFEDLVCRRGFELLCRARSLGPRLWDHNSDEDSQP